jgi:hypothetical protein
MIPARFDEPQYNYAKYVRLQVAHDAPKVPSTAEVNASINEPSLPEVSPALVRDLVSIFAQQVYFFFPAS